MSPKVSASIARTGAALATHSTRETSAAGALSFAAGGAVISSANDGTLLSGTCSTALHSCHCACT
ncbi:hypothetical protein RLIN73S_00314 [Rhodanobacter lindaniclasticus]